MRRRDLRQLRMTKAAGRFVQDGDGTVADDVWSRIEQSLHSPPPTSADDHRFAPVRGQQASPKSLPHPAAVPGGTISK